jgi:hypothetical protein
LLLEPHSRFFLRHEIQFRPLRNRGLALPLISADDTLDALTVLQEAVDAGNADVTLRNEDVVSLTIVRSDEDMAVLLFRRSDPDAATPTFENRRTRRIRLADKSEDEAVALSCHLFVHLDPIRREPLTYRAILEEVPGLGRTYVQGLIAEILRQAKYEYTDDRGEAKETYTLPQFNGIKSESIGGVAGSAGIRYVELVRPGNVEGLDTEGIVEPREEKMRLVLRTQPANPLPLLRRIREWAIGDNWSDVRIHIAMPEDRSRLVSIAREADAADVLFVRSEQVHVPTRMHQCTDTINEELAARARDSLGSAGGWG